MSEDYEAIEAAVLTEGVNVTDDLSVMRQFITAVLSMRGKLENLDAFMAEAERDPLFRRLKQLVGDGTIKWGDSEVELLMNRLMEGGP